MAGVNKAILVGNLGKDPEVRTTQNGAKWARFSLATTESYRDRDGNRQDLTEWHNIVLWRGLADIAERFLRKGSKVYLEGKIQSRSYEGQDGQTRYVTEIIGQNLTMLDSRRDGNSGGQTVPSPEEPAYFNAAKNSATNAGNSTENTTFSDNNTDQGGEDDLPF